MWFSARFFSSQKKNGSTKFRRFNTWQPVCKKNSWMFPKIVGFPPNHPLKNRVFHYINHPFWNFGVPLLLETPIYIQKLFNKNLVRSFVWGASLRFLRTHLGWSRWEKTVDGFPRFLTGFLGNNVFFSYLPFVVKAGFQLAKVRNVAQKGSVFFFGEQHGRSLWWYQLTDLTERLLNIGW